MIPIGKSVKVCCYYFIIILFLTFCIVSEEEPEGDDIDELAEADDKEKDELADIPKEEKTVAGYAQDDGFVVDE